ncbi:DUF6036 family nucleotidyltransferase [Promethearchaeum syntrophicum]|uniref:DUF6036 family nucleotidyltransferase n=1 Tax=Promethearchaeum syntrophicum TaxID=2594042 RepID=A0A5B9DBE0_9ARCH|nr:DUF6036 family nucleotidyltransferase [Candidatus Prometheoarchaeum syntrophicum]QEE15966.1 hypothetical protein DSAG12_01794 [Candidatus Prometheoarchaeum syntrophicum]
MAELEITFRKAITALTDADVKYVIVGGLAAILRGSPRNTSDIDVIIENEPNLHEKLIKAFKAQDFEVMESQLKLAIDEGFNTSIFIKDSIIRIDLKIAKNSDEIEVIKDSETWNFQDLHFPIASIEQILYGKILYLGDIKDLSDDELLDFNDVRDFVNIYQSAKSINMAWLKMKVKKKGIIETFNRILAKAKENFE